MKKKVNRPTVKKKANELKMAATGCQLIRVFKKMCSIEIVPLSVRPSVPNFFHISAPRELKI
jgi:hypothetical protein